MNNSKQFAQTLLERESSLQSVAPVIKILHNMEMLEGLGQKT